jgi:hypothetical protein
MPESFFGATRWLARSAALLVAGAYLLLVAGEVLTPHSGPPTHLREWAGIALLSAAVAGMMLAWKWELPGALISLASLAVFVPLVHMRRYDVVAIAAVPGILFLLDWALRKWRHAD